ncbi:MAG: spore coat associated protein CotJA [Eubacteriales bacterium]
MINRNAMTHTSQESSLNNFEVAMAYVPWQEFTKTYDDLEEAYRVGTIFPELTKPFSGRRCN